MGDFPLKKVDQACNCATLTQISRNAAKCNPSGIGAGSDTGGNWFHRL